MFLCAISGSPPTVPVVSTKSGHVYEKSLIEQYIDQNGTDPITNDALTKEDLVDVKAKPQTLPPRTPNQSSIPSLLTSLQAEYDGIMLESLEIKKAFQASRQELANALYREDAAVRALGRIIKERDEARSALASIQATIGTQPSTQGNNEDIDMNAGGAAEEEETKAALPADVEQTLVDHQMTLTAGRKKRKPAPGYSKAADVKTFTQTSTVPSLHSTKPAGITAIDLSSDGRHALTGGADKTVQVYDFESEKTLATLKGHTKAVTKVEFVGGSTGTILTSSADKTVKVWTANEDSSKWTLGGNMTGHKGDVVGFAVHPSKRYVAVGSADSTWSLRDIETTSIVKTYSAIPSFEGSFEYSSIAMHPDGLLYGCGTEDGKIRIWDVRDDSTLAGNLQSHDKAVTSLSFSENGYYLATGSKSDPTVNVFDLRKLSLLSSIAFNPEGKVNEVRFDPSAQFLTVVGTEAKVYANKSWEEVLTFDDNAGELTGARWSGLGEKIVLAGLDRTLRVLSASAPAA